MKTKLSSFSKRTLASVLSVLLVVSCFVVGTISTANAFTFWNYGNNNNHYIYYDDSEANISNGGTRNVYFIIGHTSYSEAYLMTKISNTRTYRYDLNVKWEGATGICFGSKTSTPSSGSNVAVTTARTNCTAYTTMYTSEDFDGNSTFYFYANSSKTLQSRVQIGSANEGDKYGDIKNKVTLSTKRMTVGGSDYNTYSSGNLATLNLQSAYWAGNTTGTLSDTDSTNGSASYKDSIVGANTTFSYSSLSSAYDFVGWYNSSGTALSTSASYTFPQTGHRSDITYYAHFKQKYNLQTTNDGHGTAYVGSSGTSTSGYVSQGSSQTVRAVAATGYVFDYWEVTGGSITQTASGLSASATVTPTSTTQNVTLKAHFKLDKFTVSVQSNNTSYGTVTPTSFEDLDEGEGGTITATPNSSNYAFVEWTASPAANVTFADSGSATTTFTATGAATITATFVQDTLYAVTVNNNYPQETSTVNVGNYATKTLTAATPDNDEWAFSGWAITGGVQITSGSTSSQTITIKATGTGTVTANYTHTDYIYFYGALQHNWNKTPVVSVNGSAVSAYKWVAQYGTTAKTLYNGTTASSTIGGNGDNTYYIGLYRVPATDSYIGKRVNVFDSVQATSSSYGYCGTLTNVQGRCYYTYSTSYTNNTSGVLEPQKVNTVSLNKSDYDGDETITVSKTETVYYDRKTAGQDSYTYTYQLINSSTSAVAKVLGSNLASNTGTFDFVPDNESIAAGTYKVRIITTDSLSGKIINSCDSSAFTIQATPTQSTVTASVSANGSVTTRTYTYKGGSSTAFSNGDSLRAGSVVTITMTMNNGYKNGTTTAKFGSSNITLTTNSYNSSTRVLTLSFTVPSGGSAITITHTPSEITHTVNVKRSYYNSDGTTLLSTDSSNYATLTGVGITTVKSTGAAPTVADYTFKKFVLPTGVTLKSGSLTTTAAITVNATVDNATIYIDYWETVYAITVQNDGHGTVQRNSSNITSTNIGNVTAVSLNAVASSGYDFKEWVITKGTATTATVGGTTYTLGSSATTIAAATAGATSSFKFNGTATLKANFKPVDYSISANFPSGNTYTKNDTTGNSITLSKTSGQIGDSFTISVLLAPGYKVKSITGTGITSTLPAATTSGNTVSYTYTLGASNVVATVTLEAKTPTISAVNIKNTTFEYATYANNTTVDMYYKQPVMAKATTDSFSTLTYTTYEEDGTVHDTKPNISSNAEVSVAADENIRPTTEDGTVNYSFKIVATNSPAGVASLTTTYSYTIRVQFNATQKVYFKLNKLKAKCVREETTNNPYYKVDAPISTYNEAFDAAQAYIEEGYPAYNAGNTELTRANNIYTSFKDAYDRLRLNAKTTTVYILTQYANSASYPMRLKVFSNGNQSDLDHFKMFMYGGDAYVNDETYTMTYDSRFTYSGDRYMYKFTYTGRMNFIIWRGTSATDGSIEDSKKLTQNVTGLNGFKEYYINAYNTSASSSASITSAVEYVDFDHTWDTSTKKFMELDETKTVAQLKTLLGVTPVSSLVTAPVIETTNTSMSITGPIGKSTKETHELVDTSSDDYDASYGNSFKAKYAGKYTVNYTTRFGYKANGDPLTATKTMTFWVATDEIDIYVDMNDNVGNPILNFKYYTNASGDPAASGTTAYLPYEMDLVTGSESIYKYTIKISKIRDEYLIPFNSNRPINISYITVENNKIGQNSNGFDIDIEARITGEVWFKANSTKLSTFQNISYGSVNKSFMAVDEDNNYLTGGIGSVHGTGIVTDSEITDTNDNDGDLYNAQYASMYTLDGQSNPVYNFGYNLRAVAKDEFTIKRGETSYKYYFDKWVSVPTPAEGAPNLSEAVDYSDSTDLNFNKAPDYNNGTGDVTYVAKYKLVSSSASTARVEITYNFQDYNTSDGNYIYNPNKDTVDASYTKTVKVPVGAGQTYTSLNAVANAVDNIARVNMPTIKSNYFDYSYGGVVVEDEEEQVEIISSDTKIKAEVYLTETAHQYTIIMKDGATQTVHEGYYQQTVELSSGGKTNPAWKDKDDKIIATGSKYTARYVTDNQIIKLVSDSSASTAGKSVIADSYTEKYFDGNTQMLKHNFYIIDYCGEGKLIGGGVLYATTDGTNYRQSNAATQLASVTSRKNFIEAVLGEDYATEYKPQTISNVGFRYKPFKDTEDVYRYSDEIGAYITTYEGTNVNSTSYNGQTLRVFSFMVYKNGSNTVVVPSEGFAEVSRYISD